jgi:ribosome-binding protein aMBF1 (putative translation factor)
MYKAHNHLRMPRSWNQFMKHLTARAKAAGPEHVRTLRALRGHYHRLGLELAEERKKLGMSQERLSAATGIDQAEISRIERQLVDPRLATYVKLLGGIGLGLHVEPLSGYRTAPRRRLSARQLRRRSAR